METIGKKIRKVIREKGYRTIKDFYDELKRTFADGAMNRSTLTRILKDKVEVRERTLNQLAIMLDVKTSYLREGTNAEVRAVTPPEGIFTYNDRAATRVLDRDLPFLTERLTLKPGGRTAELADNPDAAESVKWVYVLVGKINIVLQTNDGEKKEALHKSQRFAFDARTRHRFENASRSTSLALIVHYPVGNNLFKA